MIASSKPRGNLNVEYLYGTCLENGNNIFGRSTWKFDISMKDMERVQEMSLPGECLAMFVYA
jgi:hypothetical protein